MNLKHRVLLLLYRYGSTKLPDMKMFFQDVKCEILKAELISLYHEGLIAKNGLRGSFMYSLTDMGKRYIENAYLKHRFHELKLLDSMLFSDFNVR